jgi:hypothetical protein
MFIKPNQSALKANFILIFVAVLVATACSDIPSREQSGEFIQIQTFSALPQQFSFAPSDGVRDTIVTPTLNLSYSVVSDPGDLPIQIGYILRNALTDAILFEGVHAAELAESSAQIEIPFTVRTFDSREIGISVFFTSGNSLISNVASGNVTINGFPVGLPDILYVENPDTVQIPAAGQPNIGFRLRANVTHPLDQSLINRVLVDIRDFNNNLLPGSPFQLYDDGGLITLSTGGTSGDEVAGDSIYTRQFQLTSTNNPDVYTLFYHATDNFGASSDTLQSTMRFVR